jgi:hypothetical protein
MQITYYVRNKTPSAIFVSYIYTDDSMGPTPVGPAQKVRFRGNLGDDIQYIVFDSAKNKIYEDDFHLRGWGDDLVWDGSELSRD